MKNTQILCFLLLAFVFPATMVRASDREAQNPYVTGANVWSGSLAGGTVVKYSGVAFSTQDAANNQVFFCNYGIPCDTNTFETTTSLVTCVTRPYFEYTKCDVWINVDGQQTASAPSFTYSQGATPILAYIVSPALTPSGLGYFNIQPLTTDATKIYARLGQESTTLVLGNDEGELDLDSIGQWSYQDFTFDTGANVNLAPGYYNLTIFVEPLGNALAATRNWFYTPDGKLAQVSILPNISALSMSKGSSEGAIISIFGSGFPTETSKVTAKLGTQNAQVLSSSFDLLTLRLPKKNADVGPLKTHAGLKVYEWDNANGASSISSLRTAFNTNPAATIATASKAYNLGTTESLKNTDDKFIRRAAGWFESPLNGVVRFYVSGDDKVELYFNPTADNITPQTTPVAKVDSWTELRDYYNSPSTQISAEIGPLTAGSKYWIEIWHAESIGNDYFSVGISFDKGVASRTRPTNMATVFEVKVDAIQVYDTHQVTVSLNSNDKTRNASWSLKYIGKDSKGNNQTMQTSLVSWSASDANVASIFSTALGVGATVTHTKTLTNTSPAADFNSADVITYTVVLQGRKTRDYISISSSLASTPQIEKTVFATPQISGSFTISLLSTDVVINVCDNHWDIVPKFTKIPSISDPTTASQTGSCNEAGRTWRFALDGALPKDVPLPLLVSKSITGGSGTNDVLITSVQAGSTTKELWATIPPYLLQASSDQLEVSVQVGDIRALATGSALYTYLADGLVPKISVVSRSGLTLTVTLDNVQNTTFDKSWIDYFAYSGAVATVQTAIATANPNQYTVTATLTKNADNSPVIVAGDSYPEISIVGIGFAIPSLTLTLFDSSKLPTVTNVAPNTGSKKGFTTIVITGQFYGLSLANTFSTAVTIDGANCRITSLKNTEIVCETGAQVDASGFKLIVNGKTQTVTNKFEYTDDNIPTYSTSTPPSANPTLQTTLQISGSYGTTPVSSNFKVFLDALDTSNTVTEYGSYECFVKTVTTTLLQCVLAGGIGSPTIYNVRVIASGLGAAIPTSTIPTFQFMVSVTGITPSSGSYAGGTLLTITGLNFPEDITENQVTIGPDLIRCTIKTANPTTLTCMTGPADSDYVDDASQPVYVLSRIQDEATCSSASACQFAYSNSKTPSVTAVSINSGVAGDAVILTGTNLKAEASQTVSVTVGGVTASVKASSLSATNVEFTIPGGLSVDGKYSIQVLVGNKGYSTFAASPLSYLTITGRQILDINPKMLSQGGGILTITGGGFNPASDTVTVNGAQAKIKSITLDTIYVIVSATTSATLNVVVAFSGGSLSAPSSITVSTSSSVTPTVTSVVVSSTAGLSVSDSSDFSLDFTGTTLELEAPTVILTDKSNSSSTYKTTLSSVPSATSFTASFTNIVVGVYSVTINYPNNGYAKITASSSDVTITWTTPTISPATVSSSIAGGAQVTISGNGFPTSDQAYYIDFRACGVEGEVASTSASEIVVRMPPFITQKSLQTYDLAQVTEIFGSSISDSNPTSANNIFDGIFNTKYSSSASSCFIGVDFGANSVGMLSKIAYFPEVNSDTSRYFSTKLQGSNDNVAWSSIQITATDSSGASTTKDFTIDYEIHNGYNNIIFNEGQQPSYRYYRFLGNGAKSQCNFAEIQFWGIIASSKTPSSLTSNTCDGVLTINGKTQTFSGLVNYQTAVTPVVTKVQPSFASANGGQPITITGTGFPNGQTAATKVTVDGVTCVVSSVTSTAVACTTGQALARNLRPQSLDSSVKVWFDDANAAGYAAGWQSLYFLVTERWSQLTTWGGLPAPGVGDSVYVPSGLSLLVDQNVDVYAVIVQGGALVFSDEADYTFDAHYVFIRQGIFRAGTPERPYSHKLTITMHGTRFDSQLPSYGNKNIALREGIIDLNGIPRNPTWTFLYETALSGASIITLLTTADWQAGEEIVLASSTHDHANSETAIIASVLNTTQNNMAVTRLTLTQGLKYNHYSKLLTYTKGNGSSESIPLRTEVGLLSRNIIFQGDSNSAATEYGAHIMIFSPGDESSIGRISYIRVRNAGQAYILGRYPIHFHLIGSVSKSFVKGNAIHNTFNRATTIHGVHYLTIEDNVIYRCKGHNIFVEDGIETNNLIKNNLVISTLRSWSLLNTDQTPASFWITNPNNMYIGNHAAGSDRYGFWFDLRPNPSGPSFTLDICPPGTRLGAFRDNVAHSNGRYGLRIFHIHTPVVDPCSSPSSTNPAVPAVYENFIGWKNKRAGIIGEILGELTFSNIKTADNLQSGVELSVGGAHAMMKLIVTNVLSVGLTENAADNGINLNDPIVRNNYYDRPTRGIVTTRNDGMLVSDVRFYDWPANTVAFMDCSHCEALPATDSGARTAFVEKVYFSPSFQGKKIKYNAPYRGIFRDIDGTLTGKIGWATTYFVHNDVVDCTRDETNFNGLICNDNVQVRRIVFYQYTPNLFDGVSMYIFNCNSKSQGAVLDHTKCNTYQNDASYDFDTQASMVTWRRKQNPAMSWAIGFVTGYTYNPYWGPSGIDFDSMTFRNTPVYNTGDKVITLALNHTNYRETFDFMAGGLNLSNRTTPWTTAGSSCKYGDWQHDWTNKRLFVCVNGNQMQTGIDPATNATKDYNVTNKAFTMNAVKCRVNCPKSFQDQTREDKIRNWSVDADWVDNSQRRILATTIDRNADEVIIPASWRMRVDVPRIPATPGKSFKKLEIRGDLIIDETAAAKNGYIEIFAEVIWVRGNFLVGSNIYNTTTNKPLTEIQPYDGRLKIYLTGSKNTDGLTLSQASNPGNKVLASTGLTYIVGKPRSLYTTKLAAPAKTGEASILVMGDATSWTAGTLLGLSPTGKDITEFEYITVASTSYNTANNQTTITIVTSGPTIASFNRSTGLAVQYDHYGCASAEQVPGVGVGSFDLRADVSVLSREIVVTANELNGGTAAVDGWGASIYTSEVFFPDLVTNTYIASRGAIKIDNIRCDFCGQVDTYQAAVHVENFGTDPTNPAGYFKNSAITGSNGVGLHINKASDFSFENNVIFQTSRYGVIFNGESTNIKLKNNLVVGTMPRNTTNGASKYTDLAACVYSEFPLLGDSSIADNTVVGCSFHGFIALGGICGKNWIYQNNVARISDYPFFIKAPNDNCTYVTGMTAYGGLESGITMVYTSQNVYVDNVITVDSNIAFVLNQGVADTEALPSPVGYAKIENVFIGGAYFPYSACAAAVKSKGLNYNGCSDKIGFLLGVVALEGKSLPPTPSKLPWHAMMATGAWGGTQVWNKIQVKWFADNAEYGCSNNYVFQSNNGASDNSFIQLFSNFTVEGVDKQRIAKFTPPAAGWIGIDNCGNWPCTGIKNILAKDLDGTLTGEQSSIIPQNEGIIDSKCRAEGELAYRCTSLDWSLLTFQSLDADKSVRIFSPINITTSDGFRNDLNTMMDNCWDGFYTCLKRLSRFPSLVRTGSNYNINSLGTLPGQTQFHLFGTTKTTDWILVNLHYTQGTAVIVQDSAGNDIKPKILGPNEVTSFDSAGCGTYTYQPSTAYITVKLTGETNCTPTLVVSNTVYASVRYSMTVDEFYKIDGPSKFIDNMAAVLKIPLYKIRIVSIDKPSTNSSRRLLKDTRILEDSQKTVVTAIVILPEADQGANSTSAQLTAQNYINLLNSGMSNGMLVIGGYNPETASFEGMLGGNSTGNTDSGLTKSTTIIVIAVVIPVFIVTLAVVGYICYKKSKAKKAKIPKGEPKVIETIQQKIEPKREHTDEDPSQNNSRINLQPQNNSSVATDPHHNTNRIVVDNKMLGDRILVDNGLALNDSPNKITMLPSAKHEQRL